MIPRLALLVAVSTVLAVPVTAVALPPAPANDEPASAQVIGPDVPVLVFGTTVLANDSISTTTLPPPVDDVDGPDVFYSLTPGTTGTYRVHLFPWQRAPLRSSDRQFTVYVYEEVTTTFLAGARAPGSARAVYFDATLTATTEYIIGVDYNASLHDNFPFTLMVDQLDLTNPDNCGSAITLPSTLPVVVFNDIDGAANDFAFEQDGGRCAVSGTTPTTAPGIDHVYHFVPDADGDYAIELVGSGFPAVLYVDDSCPPFFDDGCLGASDHSTSGTSGGKHELVVVTLQAGEDYWIFVDNNSAAYNSGSYALIIDDAFNYEINEIEPSDLPAEATPIGTPLNGGQLVGPADEDWWAVTGLTDDRVYAWVNNGGSSNSTLDNELRLYAADGMTLIEYDDDDGDGADAPIEDLRYIYSTSSAVIAGARLTSDGTHYWQVIDDDAEDTKTIHRYRFHTGLEPATRTPLAECEPNDAIETADRSGKNYFAGVIPTTEDSDFYAFEATVGDRVFLAFDGDPERDATGSDSAQTDPNAFHGKLVVYDPAEDVLISDISDSNSAQTGGGDFAAQGGFFVARTTGTHYVEVTAQSAASQVGPTETYELAIFIDEEAGGAGTEDTDPEVTLTPDYVADEIAGEATDAGSEVCDVSLFADTNLQITNLSTMPAETVTFDIVLINPAESGWGKLLVSDCAGNTTCRVVVIDVDAPLCDGFNFSNRSPASLHDIIWVPDNEPEGPGIDGTIAIAESGTISDVNVTITIETVSPPDIECWLESPSGTRVELITDRGSSSAYDITDATFDDDADEIMPILSSEAPYTGTWLPEDPDGLAQLNGEDALGTWKLNVVDDYSSPSGGARLVRWSLDIDATFPSPELFVGIASDAEGLDSVVLSGASNLQLNLPPDFESGDTQVEYTVTLIDETADGSGTVVVTDLQENQCQSVLSLNGLPDDTGPSNTGGVTTDLQYGQEVQVDLPLTDPAGLLTTLSVAESGLVGEVEASITVDTKDVGRIFSTLSHGGEMAALLNRAGSDERGEPGLSKDILWIDFDDDAPQADDAHLEPALGSTPFLGLHQPDGRGELIADGITRDRRDNMLLGLAGVDVGGDWDMVVGDYRSSGYSYSTQAIFRRWSMIVKNPCGPERYVGTAMDLYPGTGVCSIALAAGAVNLAVEASFTSGDEIVDYVVTLVAPTQPGSGTLEIIDCATNLTTVSINLAAVDEDQSPPMVGGMVSPVSHEYAGTATDNEVGDAGIEAVELAPYAENLQITSMAPDPPNGASSVSFVIALIDPMANGRGYVRATDGCGLRGYALVEIDAHAPLCTGSIGHTKRYLSSDLPQALPDIDPAGVVSSIVVTDTDLVSDVDITFNITHHYDDDIDMTLTSPSTITLFTDIGSTGNDFIDTTLDDEGAAPIPDSSSEAPFTGSYQPEGGPALHVLDGSGANGTYRLRAADDATNNFGTFESWSLTIESSTFPKRYDGRAEESETHSTGICSIDLLPGATNLTLSVDPFVPGGDPLLPDLHVVRYSVEPTDPDSYGEGTVQITDCGGNTCEVPLCIELEDAKGDLNRDESIDLNDHALFFGCLTGPGWPGFDCGDDCKLGDFDDDGDVDLYDFAEFQVVFAGG